MLRKTVGISRRCERLRRRVAEAGPRGRRRSCLAAWPARAAIAATAAALFAAVGGREALVDVLQADARRRLARRRRHRPLPARLRRRLLLAARPGSRSGSWPARPAGRRSDRGPAPGCRRDGVRRWPRREALRWGRWAGRRRGGRLDEATGQPCAGSGLGRPASRSCPGRPAARWSRLRWPGAALWGVACAGGRLLDAPVLAAGRRRCRRAAVAAGWRSRWSRAGVAARRGCRARRLPVRRFEPPAGGVTIESLPFAKPIVPKALPSAPKPAYELGKAVKCRLVPGACGRACPGRGRAGSGTRWHRVAPGARSIRRAARSQPYRYHTRHRALRSKEIDQFFTAGA